MRRFGTKAKLLAAALLLVVIGILAVRIHGNGRFGTLKQTHLIEIPADELEGGMLYITQGRRRYRRGAMTLIIPSIAVYTPVGESTAADVLERMPGLYEFAQLPAEGDNNVSIAGHRDIHDMVFLELDKVEEGDYLYLLYDGMAFRYLYRSTDIVRPDNWDVIGPQGFSALTLTTCDPVGTAIHRLVVTAQLMDWQVYDGAYRFPASQAAEGSTEEGGGVER